jgi:hypothetical protein
MVFIIRRQKTFVCPEVPADKEKLAATFADAARGIRTPVEKKESQVRIPRGGSKGQRRFY